MLQLGRGWARARRHYGPRWAGYLHSLGLVGWQDPSSCTGHGPEGLHTPVLALLAGQKGLTN